ncbi:MAG: hypothetical protein J5I59_08805 [Saprospiraceae bacterium]|nr:hypothetical protein [Saprospiraceae bacterium]
MSDWINGLGVTLILIAFILLTLKIISSDSLYYKLLNMLGAGMACYGAWLVGVWAFVVLEGVWCLVAFLSFFKK